MATFFCKTQLFARLTTPRELTCKSTCLKVKLEASKRVFTYIFIVPLGPKFVLRTSWRPLAAVMLRCKAAADLATSAFGFSALIAAILVCQSSGIFQPRFSPSASFICYPSQCPLNGGNTIIPRDSSPEESPEVLPVITWLQSNLHAICFRCLHNVKLRFTFPHPLILNFAEQADLRRSNIRFRLDQAYVFSSNVYRFKTVKSVSVLDLFLAMSSATVTEKPLVGTIDIVLFASFVGVVLYWFCGRRKKTETVLSQKLVLA